MTTDRVVFVDDATAKLLGDSLPRFPVFMGSVRREANRAEVVRICLAYAQGRGLSPAEYFGGPNRIHARTPDEFAELSNQDVASLVGQALRHHWTSAVDGNARVLNRPDFIGVSLPVELIDQIRVAAFTDHRATEEFGVSLVEEAMARALVRTPVRSKRKTWWLHASEAQWTSLTARAMAHKVDPSWLVEAELRDMMARRR